jgi:hypothetical protein
VAEDSDTKGNPVLKHPEGKCPCISSL